MISYMVSSPYLFGGKVHAVIRVNTTHRLVVTCIAWYDDLDTAVAVCRDLNLAASRVP